MTLLFDIGFMRDGVLTCDQERGSTIASALALWLDRTGTPIAHVVYVRIAERNAP